VASGAGLSAEEAMATAIERAEKVDGIIPRTSTAG
jgi:hypothetical protein